MDENIELILPCSNFNKVCNNQIKCNACDQYYTKNYITKWSDICNHKYCINCAWTYIQDKIKYYYYNSTIKKYDKTFTIVKCPHSWCINELSLKYAKLIRYFFQYPNIGLNVSIKSVTADTFDISYQKLRELYLRKNKFLCSVCKSWIKNKNIYIWTHCTHQYCANCAQNSVNKYLPSIKPFLPLFGGMQPKLPICAMTGCNEKMGVEDLSRFSLTEYQMECSRKLAATRNVQQKDEKGCFVM